VNCRPSSTVSRPPLTRRVTSSGGLLPVTLRNNADTQVSANVSSSVTVSAESDSTTLTQHALSNGSESLVTCETKGANTLHTLQCNGSVTPSTSTSQPNGAVILRRSQVKGNVTISSSQANGAITPTMSVASPVSVSATVARQLA